MAKDDSKQEKAPDFSKSDPNDQAILSYTWGSRQEAIESKRTRMSLNQRNYDTYNLNGDFSHKKTGQSQEFLPKAMMATEQVASFMHQAMIDSGQWFKIDGAPGLKEADFKIKPDEITKITARQLNKIKFDEIFEDALKMGLLGSLMIAKVHGQYVPKNQYFSKNEMNKQTGKVKKNLYRSKKEVWQLQIDLVRQEDWFPDPTGDGLYEIQQVEMDLHRVQKLANGPNAIYDKKVVDQIVGGFEDVEQVGKKSRETAQNQTFQNLRKRVRIFECYGTIIDPGTGKVLHENVTWSIANDRFLIRRPTPIPFWHGKSPFVVCPIIRLPKSVWHKALMDAPTALNIALNEVFNLQLDAGIMATWGIRQFRPAWAADESKYADGIPPGETIEVNESCPPGMKVMEPIQTGTMTPESMQMFQQTSSEFNQSALTNDLRMGNLPNRQVKATEVVEASQTITSMFTGIAEVIEKNFQVEVLDRAWMTIAQHMNDLDDKEVQNMIGKDRALEIASLSNEEIFENTAAGLVFKAFGISNTLSKMKDFKKIVSLLQTIGTSEVLLEEFIKKYDFGKLLTMIMKALDIDVSEIEIDETERAAMMALNAANPAGAGATQPGTQPNMQSNISQVSAQKDPSIQSNAQSMVPHSKFPPSRATPKGGF